MQKQPLKKHSGNFLNNQNYILGKTEKKKLLSKFFVERFFKNILSFLPILNGLIYIFVGMLIFFSIPIFFFNKNYVHINGIVSLINFSLTIFLFFIIAFSLISGGIKKLKFLKYESIRDYFILDKKQKINNSIWAFVFAFLPLFILEGGYNFFLTYGLINIFIFIFFSFYLSKKKFLNIGSIIFSPIVLLFSVISFIVYLVSVFIFRGIKGYKYYKKKPHTKILEKFSEIETNRAENEFYNIVIK